MYKYLPPALALIGALLGIAIVIWSKHQNPVPSILFPPPVSPYEHSIAASGIIEASSQNISVGTPFNEIIEKIYVIEGDYVKAGDPLFQLDLRNFLAEVEVAKAQLASAKALLADKTEQFTFYKNLKDPRAVSMQDYEAACYAMLEAKENVKVAEANVLLAETNVERSIIRAPIDGQILQVNIHVGEIAPVIPFISSQATWLTAAQGTLILMGKVDPLQVRVSIDEEDSWRYQKGARATAFVRGNSHINFPIHFTRIEPYIVPKSSFTGDPVERVDTRVLQVLYNFERNDLPIYAGQVLDIFVDAGK